MQLLLPLKTDPRLPRIRDYLIAVHGPQRDEQRHDPTTQFVKAMISSRTRDAVSNQAFWLLYASLPSWDALPNSDPNIVAAIIRDVTNAPDKANHLIKAAQIIRTHRGRLNLAFLADWPVEDAFDWLDRLPGIGPKVAGAILNFSTLRKRVFVVDTHVLRISRRLGLVPDKADFERAFNTLMHLMPNNWDADDLYELHWLMKMHGQMTCRYNRPACGGCPLVPLCSHAAQRFAGDRDRRRKTESSFRSHPSQDRWKTKSDWPAHDS